MRSPKHKLTQSGKGWFKRIGRQVRWICSLKAAPTGDDADLVFEHKFEELCNPAPAKARYDVELVGDLFLSRKLADQDAGLLDRRTYRDYQDAVTRFCDTVGDDTAIDGLTPLDFGRFRAQLADYSVHRRAKYIINIRTMFNWAHQMRLIKEPDYGPDFKPPSRAEFRKARAKREAESGKLLYTPEQIGKLLAYPHAWNMRAMILLALNAGFGNTDLAELNWRAVDLDGPKIEYRRGKTGIPRYAVLWPETVAALRKIRYPKSFAGKPPEDGTVFITRQGMKMISDSGKDSVAINFFRLCENADVPNHGFYSLRRTFRTVADATGDSRAIARIMGHEIGDVADIYVQDITPDRLHRVSEHVRQALKIEAALGAAQNSDRLAAARRSDSAKRWRLRCRKKPIPSKRAAKTGTLRR